tara:strand:- start:3115 stop:4227 length:1113 start_codon:yes stop_codon:yes gene_type:complete
MREWLIGVMSGTSQDGIDAVLASFEDGVFQTAHDHHVGHYPPDLREQLLELSREATPVTLARYAQLDRAVAEVFADTVLNLIASANIAACDITAIGSHGQTVFHDAHLIGNSLQLGDPSRIAVRCGIPVVADFRRADVARGGQGAPLLPIFHHALLANAKEPRAVLNLGGIANLSLLPDADAHHVSGFDTGPASCLMDEWAQAHIGEPFDRGGQWAASGKVNEDLLSALLAEPYFSAPTPKSTGRGLFNLAWLESRAPDVSSLSPADVQCSLAELTARTVAEHLTRLAPDTQRLILCGGGQKNHFLISRLQALLPRCAVQSLSEFGLDPQCVEACAFAWLAQRRLAGLPGNLPSVTGAASEAVLGGVFLP